MPVSKNRVALQKFDFLDVFDPVRFIILPH